LKKAARIGAKIIHGPPRHPVVRSSARSAVHESPIAPRARRDRTYWHPL